LGEADLMVDTGLKPYDILPLIPILLGAGMRIERLGDKENFSEIMAGKKEIFDAII
jgi:fructose-1,6-bisphosphatase/inositol monophosphatase family enzyme